MIYLFLNFLVFMASQILKFEFHLPFRLGPLSFLSLAEELWHLTALRRFVGPINQYGEATGREWKVPQRLEIMLSLCVYCDPLR